MGVAGCVNSILGHCVMVLVSSLDGTLCSPAVTVQEVCTLLNVVFVCLFVFEGGGPITEDHCEGIVIL